MGSIQIATLVALCGSWQARADGETGISVDERRTLRECADALRMLCEMRFEDCPHAAPFRYCQECPASPCPIGLGKSGGKS